MLIVNLKCTQSLNWRYFGQARSSSIAMSMRVYTGKDSGTDCFDAFCSIVFGSTRRVLDSISLSRSASIYPRKSHDSSCQNKFDANRTTALALLDALLSTEMCNIHLSRYTRPRM